MVFGTTILGSNPSAPANKMKTQSFNFKIFRKIKKIVFPFYKSKEVKKIFSILEKDEVGNRDVAMFVGGCVRNFILDEEINDIDIATIFSPKELEEKYKNSGVKFIDTGSDHGSVTLVYNNKKFELTTLRKDTETDGRHAKVSFTDNWQSDSNRRDFTINAIYLKKNGKIFDPQLGLKDLKNKIVKFIGDPSKRIQEDYLRIIRFLRFSIQYEHFNLEKSTINAIKLNLNGINKLSKERVLDELLKILSIKKFSKLLTNNDLKNIFSLIFPELKFIDRLRKLNTLNNKYYYLIDSNFLLAVCLMDEGDNYEYFCHKYKTSNKLKNSLNTLSKFYKDYKSNKYFFSNNFKKKIYFSGKDVLKKLAILIFFEKEKFKTHDLDKIFKIIEQTSIPKFPYDGKYLKDKGFKEGKKVGLALKELEMTWIKNNYTLSEKDAKAILKKIQN